MNENAAGRRPQGMAMVAMVFALVSCGGSGADAVTPTPSPTPSPAPTPTPTPPPSPTPSPAPTPTPTPPPAPTPTPTTQTLTLTNAGAGTLTSTTAGASCSTATCSTTLASKTAVTLTAVPAANYVLGSWTGGCTGSASTCTVTLSSNVAVTANFAPTVPTAGAPDVRFTDTLSAPTSGGENGAGGYLSIFGTNFGAAGDLGTNTKVYIGGNEVANYRYLGQAKVGSQLGLQQITVQVGGLGGLAVGTAAPVMVKVKGVPSNVDSTFTPTGGHDLVRLADRQRLDGGRGRHHAPVALPAEHEHVDRRLLQDGRG